MSFILCLLLFAELLTAATAEAASELESADEPPPGTAIPAEWGLAMRIVVSDEWRMNSAILAQKVTKKTSSQVYNSVMHTLSIYTENTGNHCILTPFSFLIRGLTLQGDQRCLTIAIYCMVYRYYGSYPVQYTRYTVFIHCAAGITNTGLY